jgi:hypothetical protein
LVQPYINLTNVNYEKTTTQYKSTSDINPYVHVKVGEEYTVSGVTTSLTGSGVTGAPGYFLSPYGATGYSVRVIPASLDFNTQIGIMQDTTVFNPFWSNYIMDGNDSKFLSLEPGDRSIRLTDRYTLTFLNIWDFAGSPGTYAQSILGMEYKLYNAAGTMTYSNFINNTVANGGGPQTTATYTSITSVRGTNFLTFRCGPADLADIALAFAFALAFCAGVRGVDFFLGFGFSQNAFFFITCRNLCRHPCHTSSLKEQGLLYLVESS